MGISNIGRSISCYWCRVYVGAEVYRFHQRDFCRSLEGVKGGGGYPLPFFLTNLKDGEGMKKSIAAFLIVFFFFPLQSLADGEFIPYSSDGDLINTSKFRESSNFKIETYAVGDFTVKSISDPSKLVTKQPYYNSAADSIHVNISGTRAVTAKYTSYTDSSFSTVAKTKTLTAAQYGWQYFNGLGFNCNVAYEGELLDSSGNTLLKVRLVITGLVNPVCDSESGGEDVGGDGDGGDGDGQTCDNCAIFDCPGWDEHLGKLDAIKNAIPPPPNWNQVSQTFSDAIVPRLVSETKTMLSELLGKAPTPPPSLPDLPPLNDHNFEQKKPVMQDVPGLEGFTKDDVEKGAPVLPYEDDPSGGFNLTVDPVNNLPDVVPGGDPGAYKRDPNELPATYPGKPKETDVDMGGAPKPSGDVGTPPKPEGAPSKPDDGAGFPSKPNDVTIPTKDNYMPNPKGG